MKNFIKFTALATILIGLAGCNTFNTFENMDAGLTSLKGQPYQSVINILGQPNKEKMEAGKHIYTWFTTDEFMAPGLGAGRTNTLVASVCHIDITTNSKNIIESYKYYGRTLTNDFNEKDPAKSMKITQDESICAKYGKLLKVRK